MCRNNRKRVKKIERQGQVKMYYHKVKKVNYAFAWIEEWMTHDEQ